MKSSLFGNAVFLAMNSRAVGLPILFAYLFLELVSMAELLIIGSVSGSERETFLFESLSSLLVKLCVLFLIGVMLCMYFSLRYGSVVVDMSGG